MATWEQILTSGTSITKLSDVTVTTGTNGDLLIMDSGVWVDATLTGTATSIKVTPSAGGITLALHSDVTIPQDLNVTRNAEVTGDLTVNGGDTIFQNASVDRDTTLTIKSGATAKDAIISLWGNNGAAAGDEWEIRAKADNVLTVGNDVNTAGTYVPMLTLTPDSTAVNSKAEFVGDLHVHGQSIKLGGDTTIAYASDTLTITEGTIELAGLVTVSNGLGVTGAATVSNGLGVTGGITASTTISATTSVSSAQVNGTTSVRTPLIEFTDGDDAITIADGGAVGTNNTLTVGTDLTVTGGDMNFSNAQASQIYVADTASGTAGKDLTVRAGTTSADSSDTAGGTLYLKAGGTDGTGTSIMEFYTAVAGDAAGAVSKAMEINSSGNVVIARNLTVSGTTVTLDTETLLVEDNAIVLNSNATGDAEDGADAGIIVKRGAANITNKNAALFWDESYANVDVGAADLGGRWAVGLGTESGTAPATTFTAPAIATYGGYVVGITESAGAPDSADLATGLGAMHIKTGSPGQIYIRVA